MSIQTSQYKKNDQLIKIISISITLILLTLQLLYIYNKYILNSRKSSSFVSTNKVIEVNQSGLKKALQKIK
jgi:hypothetical protein